ncbi:MAG: CRISPR system precrRNA processing endoribonuclease RAMP protein Cas6, partial [Nitrospirae bacterium]
MLVSFVLEISPVKDTTLPVSHGRALHGMFLGLISKVAPEMADALHEGPTEDGSPVDRPFTLSLIYGRYKKRQGELFLSSGERYFVRITGIEKGFSSFLEKLPVEVMQRVQICSEEFLLREFYRNESEHPDVKRTTYEELVKKYMMLSPEQAMALPPKIKMTFVSPATFRQGNRNLPLPVPSLVFHKLLSRWERFSSVSFREEPRIPHSELLWSLTQELAIGGYNLRTRMLDFGNYRMVGFIGDCEFVLKPKKRLPAYRQVLLRQWLHIMKEYAFYAGVGYKTTMGMGQVRVE